MAHVLHPLQGPQARQGPGGATPQAHAAQVERRRRGRRSNGRRPALPAKRPWRRGPHPTRGRSRATRPAVGGPTKRCPTARAPSAARAPRGGNGRPNGTGRQPPPIETARAKGPCARGALHAQGAARACRPRRFAGERQHRPGVADHGRQHGGYDRRI